MTTTCMDHMSPDFPENSYKKEKRILVQRDQRDLDYCCIGADIEERTRAVLNAGLDMFFVERIFYRSAEMLGLTGEERDDVLKKYRREGSGASNSLHMVNALRKVQLAHEARTAGEEIIGDTTLNDRDYEILRDLFPTRFGNIFALNQLNLLYIVQRQKWLEWQRAHGLDLDHYEDAIVGYDEQTKTYRDPLGEFLETSGWKPGDISGPLDQWREDFKNPYYRFSSCREDPYREDDFMVVDGEIRFALHHKRNQIKEQWRERQRNYMSIPGVTLNNPLPPTGEIEYLSLGFFGVAVHGALQLHNARIPGYPMKITHSHIHGNLSVDISKISPGIHLSPSSDVGEKHLFRTNPALQLKETVIDGDCIIRVPTIGKETFFSISLKDVTIRGDLRLENVEEQPHIKVEKDNVRVEGRSL